MDEGVTGNRRQKDTKRKRGWMEDTKETVSSRHDRTDHI